jgi:hypothetical protein
MNEVDELQRVRLLRDTVPWPAPARLANARARLLAAAQDAEQHAPRRLRSARGTRARLVVSIAAAAAVAAGIAGYAISGRTASPGRHAVATSPTASHAHQGPASGPAAALAVLAARVLRTAADHVAVRGVSTEPGPGQWIYSKTVDYQRGQAPAAQGDENWKTFDGASSAYYQSGQLTVHVSPVAPPGPGVSPWAAWNADITPKTAYDVLASLPADPRALLAAVARESATHSAGGSPLLDAAPKTEAQREFDYLAAILWNAAGGVGGPPAADATAYRALATLPGISVQPGVTDAAGNPAIGISDDGGYGQLLIDPVNYQVTGLRWLSTGIAFARVPPSVTVLRGLLANPRAPLPAEPPGTMPLAQLRKLFEKASKAEQDQLLAQWQKQWEKAEPAPAPDSVPPKGTVLESLAYAQVTEVAGPGQR